MRLLLEWGRPVLLKDAVAENMIYTVNLDRLTDMPGIYVFARRYADSYEALYVGKANNIRVRVRQQLNNLRLMQHLKHSKNGRRVLLPGEIVTKPGQQLAKTLELAERALIRHFLSEGHELVNVSGTKLRRHELESWG